MTQKELYFTTQLDAHFFILKGCFWNYIPVWVPYGRISGQAQKNKLEIDPKFGVLEKAVPFGKGWIGIKVQNNQAKNQNLLHLHGEYQTHEHLGSYRKLWKTYQIIMRDYPKATDFYNLYLNDPKITPEKELKTRILFKP
jgi:hypothetical protein